MYKKLLKYISHLFVLSCIIFIIRTVLSLSIDFSVAFSISALKFIVPSTMIIIANLFIWAFVYKRNIEIAGNTSINYNIAKSIFLKSNIAKYLPGNFMQYAGRNLLGAKYEISQKVLFSSSVLLMLQSLIAAFFICISISFEGMAKALNLILVEYDNFYRIIMLVAAIIVGFVIFKIISNKERFAYLYSQKYIKHFCISTLILSSILVLYSFSFLLLFYGFLPDMITLESISIIISSYVIAWFLGTITPGAPGGIGVRETVLLLLMSNVFISENIVFILIVHRVVSIIADIIGYIIANFKISEKQFRIMIREDI